MKKHLFGLFNFESNACLFYITGYPLQIFKKKFLLNNSVMLYFMMFDYMLESVLSEIMDTPSVYRCALLPILLTLFSKKYKNSESNVNNILMIVAKRLKNSARLYSFLLCKISHWSKSTKSEGLGSHSPPCTLTGGQRGQRGAEVAPTP